MKKVLITGKDSYIGISLEQWLMREPDNYKVDTVDMKDESWKEKDFSEKYLNGSEDFSKLTTITSGDEDQFVVVPKGKDSKIKVWTYKVTEAGEIVIDKVIAENVSEPILIKAETAEVAPKVGIEYEGNNQKIVLPLILSGKDGKIILGEKSNLIKDISEY